MKQKRIQCFIQLCIFIPFLVNIPLSLGNDQAANFSHDLLPRAENDRWDDRFFYSGISKTIEAIAVDGNTIYIGGNLEVSGRTPIGVLAKWDGASWSSIGTGSDFDGSVYAIAVQGSNLFVGGSFTHIGSVSANRIARWDGTKWNALDSGLSGSTGGGTTVYDIAVSGSDVYVAGDFTTAGGVSANHVARWSGSSWAALGPGLGGIVYALAMDGEKLYAGGYFKSSGETLINSIARWDGSKWLPLGRGIDNPSAWGAQTVYCLAVGNGYVYAGGAFYYAGGKSANCIAKWDGSSWSTVGEGLSGGGEVYAITVHDGDLYLGGHFYSVMNSDRTSVDTPFVAKWTGSQWSPLGKGLNLSESCDPPCGVRAVGYIGNEFIAGGAFNLADQKPADSLMRFDGSTWARIVPQDGDGFNNSIKTLAIKGDNVYAAGNFSIAGHQSVTGLAKWAGSEWSQMGIWTNWPITTVSICKDDIYVGSQKSIFKWDGNSWTEVGLGIEGKVNAIASDGNNVYAGGLFSKAGGLPAKNIAKWDGTNWSSLGAGVDDEVKALVCDGSNLYAGGVFRNAGGKSANYIARWTGSAWVPLGTGFDARVNSLSMSGGVLYAGGNFTVAGGLYVGHVAQWNGSSWSVLGKSSDGVNGEVYAISSSGKNVFVGGLFSNYNYVVRWDGSSWRRLGSGTDNTINAMALQGDYLWVGGAFTQAGGKQSKRIGKWLWRIPNDVDDNGIVDAKDSEALARYLTNADHRPPSETGNEDINKDGIVDILDLIQLKVNIEVGL